MKKIFAMLIAIALVVSIIPSQMHAETPAASGTCGENATWAFSADGVLTISGTGSISSWNWGVDPTQVKTVVVENGITELWSVSFSHCTQLTSVSLPETLEVIGNDVFANCAALTEIRFPNSLKQISANAFANCTGLTEIALPLYLQQLGDYAFSGCTGLRTIRFNSAVAPFSYSQGVFEGVTATVYYLGTRGWEQLKSSCGGNLQWESTRSQPTGVYIDYYLATGYVGDLFELFPYMNPGYAAGDFEISVDNDVLAIESAGGPAGYCVELRGMKAGVATVTAKEKATGQTASVVITVKESETITCGFEETFTFEAGKIYQEYKFTPEESGVYVFSTTKTERFGFSYPYMAVFYEANGEPNCWLDCEAYGIPDGEEFAHSYRMEAGVTYRVRLELDDNTFDYGRDQAPIPVTFRANKQTPVTGIEIIGGEMVLGAKGVTLNAQPMYLMLSGVDAIKDADVVWESSDPELMKVEYDLISNGYVLNTYGEGAAVITVKWKDFSDSITVTAKKPKELQLDKPVQFTASVTDGKLYAFTPTETGNYTFLAESGNTYLWREVGGVYLTGAETPTVVGRADDGVQKSVTYALTAGTTYYVKVDCGAGSECKADVTCVVRKDAGKATSAEIVCSFSNTYIYSQAIYAVRYFPGGAYDNIVSWESSDPNIVRLDQNPIYGTSFYPSQVSAEILGSGEVTLTAVTESGLRVSRTITVGACAEGHTYGEWKDLRTAQCDLYGSQVTTCSVCALEQYRKVTAVGHSYDHACDTTCNTCGDTREALHDFGQNWSQDQTAHWRTCRNCGERKEYQNHIPGAEATETTPQTCTVCGYVITPVLATDHPHVAGEVWLSDEDGHWHPCTACGEKMEYQFHIPGAAATESSPKVCVICEYVMEPPIGHGHSHTTGVEWTVNESEHWHICVDCGEKVDAAEHTPVDGVCSVCNYHISVPEGNGTAPTVKPVVKPTLQSNEIWTIVIYLVVSLGAAGALVAIWLNRGKFLSKPTPSEETPENTEEPEDGEQEA